MIEEVLETMNKYDMIKKGDKVIVGVSGGPDSMCLLHLLYSLKKDFNISIVVAHLNHCLRGKDADEDEIYVRRFCENLNIEFYNKKVDVNKISQEKGISCETAGREARYNFFEKLKQEIKAQKIALAHNANDRAETIIMRIMRGTGLEGLIGIKPVRDSIIRPLINIDRKHIESYCSKNNIKPRIDKTNFESIYARNKVRLELIPYIEENFNKDIIQTINRLSDIVEIDNSYLNEISQKMYKKYCYIKLNNIIISKEAFLENRAILSRIIRIALGKLKGNLYNVQKSHIDDVVELQKGDTGKKIILPNEVVIQNNYGNIYMCEKKIKIEKINNEFKLNIGINNVISMNINVKLNLINNGENLDLNKKYVKYFDYDKIKEDITIRYRQNGDLFVPFGMKGNKKLKDLFIDLKIPRYKRDKIPIICFDGNIGWVVGVRIGDLYKVCKDTKKILEIKIEREE
ncbi:tRNA(Ile)-lysidine synthase [Clostridium acetireducens DSM 10703]|uniref:tRNA(Ile)-lysidine synthase n=1 Tax=Clostridium acetireducens DSM 10703 TaxID=1121290 RepID=A0A1E8F0A7_9CLOT|nr:tRNA lysidine(34) synthetase TilS [Clostridium acetireducens]OFI06564.1 tRNA(Ile)-lysidine synthase [Clostridium acetireducens DSM 10703]